MLKKSVKNKEKPKVSIVEKNNVDNIKTVYSSVPIQFEGIKPFENDPEKLLLLYQLSRYSNLNSDVEDSLQLIVERLYDTFHPDRIFIALLEKEGAILTCLAKHPNDKNSINVSRTMLNYLLNEKQAFITNDAITDKRFKKYGKTAKSVINLNVMSAVTVPLEWDGGIKGMLYMDSSKLKGHFDNSDIEFLTVACNDISFLIEQNLNLNIVKDKNIRLEKLLSNGTIVGISEKTKGILKSIEKFSKTDASILITGETGTGKDLVANAIHTNSKRKEKQLIVVNCAAIPDNLLESELFGVVSSYPGLHNKEALKGKFQLADGGTFFLDEVGELPLKLQAKLLAALEEKSIWPLGAKEPLSVDVRIIAATNRNLQEEIDNGNFREDLYERLNILRVHMPPLRERKEDIILLANYFLYQMRQKYGKRINRFSNACIELLSSYEWPRNIRELKNAVERAIIVSEKPLITPALFELKKGRSYQLKTLEEIEKEHIVNVMKHTQGNKEKALRILGITRQTLYNKGKKYSIPGFGRNEDV